MKILNKTKRTTIAINVLFAKNIKERTKGLLGENKPHAMVFKTRFGIHTFGMKFPIDVIVLDANNKVVKIKTNIKPNNIFFWNPSWNVIIELPNETIVKTKTKIGDLLEVLD